MEHQDWNTVVFRKKKQTNENPERKAVSMMTHEQAKAHKLANDHDFSVVVEKPTLELRKAIQQARLQKKWTQADLAAKIAVKKDEIVKIEAGSMKPPPDMRQKLNRVLGITLPKS